MHILAYSDISLRIQPDIIRHIQAYSEPCVTLTYSEPWYMQNLDIFRTASIFRTLVYSETRHLQNQRHIQNPGIFKSLAYSETWMESFLKIVNILYEIHIMNFFNTGVIFTPIAFILCKSKEYGGPGGRGR